jgi:glycosyltransferase involved in cell wall biosynthesis
VTGGVALAHDYATQRGGAERVALLMAEAFPGAPMYTTLYEPATTYPQFAGLDVRTVGLNRVGVLRRHHRAALPFLAPAVSGARPIEADVVLASSTGWAHGFRTTGRKVVYCHAPARWLYQADRYAGTGARGAAYRAALGVLGPALRSWDRQAAASADRYLVNSTTTAAAVREAYGLVAEVLPPPPALVPGGAEEPVPGLEPGFVLCVARLLPYKNVDVVIDAVQRVPGLRLVVVGDGPERDRLAARVHDRSRVRLVGRLSDEQLRWCYRACALLVAASYEDYGLSPLEAASFGRPTVALRAGGFLDTLDEGATGLFFDAPTPDEVAAALEAASGRAWDEALLRSHADAFGAERFRERLRAVVAETAR